MNPLIDNGYELFMPQEIPLPATVNSWETLPYLNQFLAIPYPLHVLCITELSRADDQHFLDKKTPTNYFRWLRHNVCFTLLVIIHDKGKSSVLLKKEGAIKNLMTFQFAQRE